MSKSVKLSSSDASTGRTKNSPMAISAGRGHRPGRRAPRRGCCVRRSSCSIIQRRFSSSRSARRSISAAAASRRHLAAHHAFGDDLHLGDDPFPLGHLGQRASVRSSWSREGLGDRVGGEPGAVPHRAARRQVAGQLLELGLRRGVRQSCDQLPGRGGIARAGVDDQARPAGRRAGRGRRARGRARSPSSTGGRRASRDFMSPIVHGPEG